MDDIAGYLLKAKESLQGAESEFAAGRFNNVANRGYYAAFVEVKHILQTKPSRKLGLIRAHHA